MNYMKIHCLRPIAAVALAIVLSTSSAQAAPKFDYMVVSVQRTLKSGVEAAIELADLLNEHGAQGWELIQIDGQGRAIFKRAR
ncbi:MAG TPA: DUF4177 domain-containing protein [Chthoniobacterales bacterium]|nr:DUF4177 domain-containing protein [Chthoniobacterales bacterium]